jgi:hypothetical protein
VAPGPGRGLTARSSVLSQLICHAAAPDTARRHTFEVTHIAGTPTHGLYKDVVMLGGYQARDVDFTADQPGLSLLHCHQQLHMDYGFMMLLRCS